MIADRRGQRSRLEVSAPVSAAGFRFAVVVSRFNDTVTSRLLAGALESLRQAGAKEDDIEVFHVPGAFEIPLVAKKVAGLGRFDAVICIGAVVRGETPHFDYICEEVSRGIMEVSLRSELPVIFGVLTADTPEQAMDRAGLKTDKGKEAALAAIEMANLLRGLS